MVMYISFTGDLTPDNEYVHAIYPHSSGGKFTDTLYSSNFAMDKTQRHKAEDKIDTFSIGDYAYMYGRSESLVSTTDDVAISMKHLTAILDFNLTNLGETGTMVNFLSLRAESDIIPNYTGVAPVEDSLTIRLAILPTTVPTGGKLTIAIQTVKSGVNAVKYFTKTLSSGQTFEAGKVYPTNLDYSKFTAMTEGVTTSDEASKYPTVTSGVNIYVYDRNAGKSVPTQGDALNYTNAKPGENSAFKGDHYTWAEALIGMNSDGTSMCPKGWRLPNYNEMTAIKAGIKTNNPSTLTGVNTKTCFFPFSGIAGASSTNGYYWTSNVHATVGQSYRLEVKSNTSALYYSGWDRGFSVRCVKTI